MLMFAVSSSAFYPKWNDSNRERGSIVPSQFFQTQYSLSFLYRFIASQETRAIASN